MRIVGPRTQHPLAVLVLGLLTSSVLIAPALAAEDAASQDAQPEISLRVSPAVLEVPLQTGPARHEMRLDNRGSQPLKVEAELAEFTVTEDGTTTFLGSDELSATSWAELDTDTFELAPGERRDIVLTVDVPDEPEPGERNLSVIFAVPGNPDAEGNISVTHRVATKVYIEVPGQRSERIELGDLTGPRLVDGGTTTFELPVHNRGNVHRRFEEDSQIMATTGHGQFSFDNFTVIGNATREVEAVWANPPLLCWCTIEIEVDDGQGNLLVASTRVIAFPLRLTLGMTVFLAGLVVLAIGRRRRRAARFEQQLDAARREGADTRTAPRPPAASVPPAPAAPSPRHRTRAVGRAADRPRADGDAGPARAPRTRQLPPPRPSPSPYGDVVHRPWQHLGSAGETPATMTRPHVLRCARRLQVGHIQSM